MQIDMFTVTVDSLQGHRPINWKGEYRRNGKAEMGAVTGLWLIHVRKNCLVFRETDVLKGFSNMFLCRREMRQDFCLGNPEKKAEVLSK